MAERHSTVERASGMVPGRMKVNVAGVQRMAGSSVHESALDGSLGRVLAMGENLTPVALLELAEEVLSDVIGAVSPDGYVEATAVDPYSSAKAVLSIVGAAKEICRKQDRERGGPAMMSNRAPVANRPEPGPRPAALLLANNARAGVIKTANEAFDRERLHTKAICSRRTWVDQVLRDTGMEALRPLEAAGLGQEGGALLTNARSGIIDSARQAYARESRSSKMICSQRAWVSMHLQNAGFDRLSDKEAAALR